MSGCPSHVPVPDNNDTRCYNPRRTPSFADYDFLPILPPPPSYRLPPPVHRRYVSMSGRLWEISSPNSLLNAFCPGVKPSNLNLGVGDYKEEHRRYDGHMGPFDPTRNPQLTPPGKEWRPLIISHTAGNPRDCPEYESVLNCWKSDKKPAFDSGRIHDNYLNNLIRRNQEADKRIEALYQRYVDYHFFDFIHSVLWRNGTRPRVPPSEYIDSLR